jgi:hypothetical protein
MRQPAIFYASAMQASGHATPASERAPGSPVYDNLLCLATASGGATLRGVGVVPREVGSVERAKLRKLACDML